MTSFNAYAQEITYIKNNQLCIKNVCVGDDIQNLKSIKFELARMDIGDHRPYSQIKVTSNDINKVVKEFMAPRVKTISPEIVKFYWERKFDNTSIDILTKEKGFCKPIGDLTGSFVTDSGVRTSIYINIRVENNYTQQTWRVVGIRQHFSADMTYEQKKQLNNTFFERYKQRDPINPGFGWTYSGSELVLSEIDSSSGAMESNEDKLKKYPGCGTKLVAD